MANKILIIDDEFSFAQFAKILLERMGYEVAVLLDGRKAKEKVLAEKPDLILMDMYMRLTSGTEVIRELKSDSATRDIPIILCSMTKQRDEVQDAMDSGAVSFLPKPLKESVLKTQIEAVLGTR